MKRFLISILLAASCAACIAAGNWQDDFSLSLEPFIGFMRGTSKEYAYTGSTLLSRLDWQVHNAWQYGIKADATYKRLFADGSLSGTLPLGCGTMYDSDWMNRNDVKTHYSESDNTINSFFRLDLNLGYIFKPVQTVQLIPFTGIEYMFFDMAAYGLQAWYGNKNKSGIYSAYNSTDTTIKTQPGSTQCIQYVRQTFFTWLGLNVRWQFTRSWECMISGAVSPYLWSDSLDHHILRGYFFYDYMAANFAAWKGSVTMRFYLTPRLSLNALIGAVCTREIKGVSKVNKTDERNGIYYSNGNAAASDQYLIGSLSLRFTLF